VRKTKGKRKDKKKGERTKRERVGERKWKRGNY
jgi:hypothetical protein